MNPEQHQKWKDDVLQHVLEAIASNSELREALVFKGARILNFHLNTRRQSLDIDSNLTVEFQQSLPNQKAQAEWFHERVLKALTDYFENQDPVRFAVTSIRVESNPSPARPHPHGWDMLIVKVRVNDAVNSGVPNLPTLEIEIAAPEELGPSAVEELTLDGASLKAYALHRIAGEKLRAFLTSLQAYRQKMRSNDRAVRAKDLYDLARIIEDRPISNTKFWKAAAEEFSLACRSRFVDCDGLVTFHENWPATQQAYQSDATLNAVPWSAAAAALATIVGHLTSIGTFPLVHPINSEPSCPAS